MRSSSWSSRRPVVLGVALALASGAIGAGCKKRLPPPPPVPVAPAELTGGPAPPTTTATTIVLDPPQPLPGGAPDGAIGVAGPIRLVGAADDGAWVMTCPAEGPGKLRVVVGDGPGLEVDRVVAATDRDLAVIVGDALIHVDVVARTSQRLGRAAYARIDADSRRLVQADGRRVIVRDPGAAPRTIDTGVEIAGLWARSRRWLEVAPGTPARDLTEGACGWVDDHDYQLPVADRTTIDLDPSGVEAAERIGPELGITASGEVTLDGAVVVAADCVAHVIAALAEPPRALVMCGSGRNRVVGAGGFVREVGGNGGRSGDQATIADQLILGRRVICLSGACIDLVTGRDFATYDHELVAATDRVVVRKQSGGLLLDDLDQERQRRLALPRVTQAVTVDTATGRRRAGPAPAAPVFVDLAGHYLLYGRFVVDLEAGTLVATVAEGAIAIERAGRVLVPVAPGQGPLRWRGL